MGFINKMERRFGKFAIEGLMKYVIGCYVIGYVIQYFLPNLYDYLTLEPYLIFHGGQVWRIISWVLIPPSRSNIIFVLIMLVLYYQLGTALERHWGTFRFNLYIFGGVIFTIIGALIMFAVLGYNTPVSIGSGFSTYFINLTIFLAFAMCFPDMQVMLYFIIPIKMKWMAIVYAVFIIIDLINYSWPGRVAIIAALANFLVFFAMTRKYSPIGAAKQYKRKVEYRKQVQQPKGITKHKCAICGRTELDDPNLQFRFCSKCNGNYEYCQDHLYTHTHVE